MDEKKRNRKEWVKTVAIIFLSILLVLTFFSQTIMNYSLPQVSVQYIESGSITAKIRDTGVIESSDPYNLMTSETRKVAGILVKIGDHVDKGTPLVQLAEGDSTEIEEAKEKLETAKKEFDDAVLQEAVSASDIYAAKRNISADEYRAQITSAQDALRKAENEKDAMEVKVNAAKKKVEDIQHQITNEESIRDSLLPERIEATQNALAKAEREQQNAKDYFDACVEERDALKGQLDEATVSGNDAGLIADLTQQLNAKEEKVAAAQTALDQFNANLTNATNEYNAVFAELENRKGSTAIINMKDTLASYNNELYNLDAELTRLTNIVTEKDTALKDLISDIGNVTALEKYAKAIQDAQRDLEKLQSKDIGDVINSEIAGKIIEINVASGKEINTSDPVVVIQPDGQGYTLTLTVDKEKAAKVNVGDKAELVNAWKYDGVEVTLRKIVADKTDPGKKKQLIFDVDGDVQAGQSFTISCGQKSANYDLIVPKSAVHHDNDGYFVLILESKSSALGNRYFATRVDVEVLAEDETKMAIQGALYGSEYVITTSTEEVKAGKQVRLAES